MKKSNQSSMVSRFEGINGKSKLIEALKNQKIIGGDEVLAQLFADKISLIELNSEAVIIEQNAIDTDMYFIISGTVKININGRIIAERNQDNHVGELALIDPTARRSATVIAKDLCVLAKISEPDFTIIAQMHPKLWRFIALESANRLRERSKHVKKPNDKPNLFIGSSVEQLSIARAIQLGLSHDFVIPYVWTDNIFEASTITIDSLMKAIDQSDFSVLVISQDDLVISRGTKKYGPRDNIVFELGLFMGGIGYQRTFIVQPQNKDLKMPSDLLGVTPITYALGDESSLDARIAPVCTQIRKIINKLGVK
jgi:CRP/FNR family cyclic AMP-dependent transcriptional regulator